MSFFSGMNLILIIGLPLSGSLSVSCSFYQSDFYTPQEANEKIMGAFLLQNSKCGTNRMPAVPIYSEARKGDVENCVSAVLATDCASWASNEAEIPVCLAVELSL